MRRNKVSVKTYGMSESQARPLLFLETGRGDAIDEAFLLLCEASVGGRRVFQEAVAQYRRGERIRTPEQYVELVSEIASSCCELLNEAPISFATTFVRGETFWWAAQGKFSVSCVSRDGRVDSTGQERGAGHLQPGERLAVGQIETLSNVGGGLEAEMRSHEVGSERPAIVVELTRAPLLGELAARGKVSAERRFFLGFRFPKLSPFGWISLIGIVAVIGMLLFTAWPTSKKTSSRLQEKTLQSKGSAAVAPTDTAEKITKSPGEFSLSLKWKKKLGGAVTSSPCVREGKVYFGCRDGGLYCLDSETGEQVWKFSGGAGIGASPAISDGKVFIGGYDGSFWCVDAVSGQKIWRFKAGAKIVSSAFFASGNVLFGSYDRNLYSVSAKDGRLRWKYKAASVVWVSPFAEKGRVFFASVDGTFYCLSLDSGKLLWKYTAPGGVYSSPAVSEGVVCFGSSGRAFHFLEASNGKEIFRIEAGRDVRASPLVLGESAYGASDDGVVRCINVKKRTVGWTFKAQRAVRSTPLLSDGVLYFTSYDGKLYALEASSGKKLGSFDSGAEIYSSPAVSNNMVYFGANNGYLYCLQAASH